MNLLLATDAYKFGGHADQYPEGTNKIYSYLIARSDKKYKECVFFGLQYYLKKYLTPISMQGVREAMDYYRRIFNAICPPQTQERWYALAKLGYIPLHIKAIPEGTVLPVKNVMCTITNTHPDFYWLVGYVESLLLKVWNTITVATFSRDMRLLCEDYLKQTSDNYEELLPYLVHDFGYRGCSSDETAALSGAAHLLNFKGTDTVPAVQLLYDNYTNSKGLFTERNGLDIGHSVPASEHSVMCAYGKDNEIDAFRRMLKLYPTGIVSIVSDTYNLWNVFENILPALKDEILARDGKVVIRPDSGDPVDIICGRKTVVGDRGWIEKSMSFGQKGCLQYLDELFGHTVNSKGYKALNPKVGLIYGDGMYMARYEQMLKTMKELGYATSNLVVGVGGLLLQQHNRDDLGISFKATYCEVNGEPRNIRKDPITDSGKRSHTGLMYLEKSTVINKNWGTNDRCSKELEECGELQTVFRDGDIKHQSYVDIRIRIWG